jgi:type II secretory pathway pseudopilin PulG
MKSLKRKNETGFSLIELMVTMTCVIIMMGMVSILMKQALGTKSRESSRTDALTSAQAALNVITREIANSGYGLADYSGSSHNNGIVLADSNSTKVRVRANTTNSNMTTDDLGEDVTYYYDTTTQSIVRHDPKQTNPTTYLVNRISSVNFQYFNYVVNSSTSTTSTTPTSDTARIRITVIVQLEEVQGQPTGRTVTLTSDVTLRNSNYMIYQY